MIQGILKKVFKAREKLGAHRAENPEAEKPFLEHLEDLRTMIVRIVSTLIISLLICFIFNSTLIKIIEAPLSFIDVPVIVETVNDQGETVTEIVQKPLSDPNVMRRVTIDPVGVFMLAIKVSFLAAITVSIPFLIYFILQFVLPGLRENERKILWPAMAIGFGLFIAGALFAYFVVVPRAMEFFYSFAVDRGVDPQWTIELYTKFAVRFILIFGICFELPVVVMALVKLDILNYKFMSTRRGMALVIIFFVAAVITPTQDALTLTLLGAPMYILYEICIWMAYFIDKRDRAANPDLYAARDRIEAELAAEADKPIQWGGFGGTDEDDHHHDDYHDDHHRDDPHHHDYHDPYHDHLHGEDWHDPHAAAADDPYHHDHDDYGNSLHNPDHDNLGDPDHGGSSRPDATSHSDENVQPAKVADPYHHDQPTDNDHGIYQDEIDEYHRHLAEAEAAEQAAFEAEAATAEFGDHGGATEPVTTEKLPEPEATLEEFSARDEATTQPPAPVSDMPTGAALGDTTGLGDKPAHAQRDLESRIRDLESLVTRMAERLAALEDRPSH